MALEEAKRRSEQVSGVSNVSYNLLTELYNKLKGIAALEEYKQDAQQQGDQEALALFEQLQQRAVEDVNKLRSLVVQRLQQS
jgi:hypothetical protein